MNVKRVNIIAAALFALVAIGFVFGISAYQGTQMSPTQATTEQPITHAHVYVLETVQATCGQSGYTLHICACGESFKDNEIAPLAHNYGA